MKGLNRYSLPSSTVTISKTRKSGRTYGVIIFGIFILALVAIISFSVIINTHGGKTIPIRNDPDISSNPASQPATKLHPKPPTSDATVISSTSLIQSNIPMSEESMKSLQKSPHAYVTLLSGIDSTFRYRGFLYNTMIMKEALQDLGSTADFIVMIGFGHEEKNLTIFDADLELLRQNNIIIYHLPRFVDDKQRLSFAEMALLKITPWSFIQYKRIQYFDGDVMPTKNMDCFFKLDYNSFTVGAASPLNSGWYLEIPNINDFNYMKTKAHWRLGKDWDKSLGWAEKMPDGLYYRGGQKLCDLWDFNGADMDQGMYEVIYVCMYYIKI